MTTYKPLTISGSDAPPTASGELGEFTLGFDDFGGSVTYGDGIEFAVLDRPTDQYGTLTAYPAEYQILRVEE